MLQLLDFCPGPLSNVGEQIKKEKGRWNAMTVAELIEILKNLPQDLPVVVELDGTPIDYAEVADCGMIRFSGGSSVLTTTNEKVKCQ